MMKLGGYPSAKTQKKYMWEKTSEGDWEIEGRVKVRERDQKSKRKIYSPINLPKNKEKWEKRNQIKRWVWNGVCQVSTVAANHEHNVCLRLS